MVRGDDVDDGWILDEREASEANETGEPGAEPAGAEPDPEQRHALEALIREALTLLDGEAPEHIALEGEGWSLLDPDRARRIH